MNRAVVISSRGAWRGSTLPKHISRSLYCHETTPSPRPTRTARLFHTCPSRQSTAPEPYAAVVAGAGPAGLAVVGNVLENRAGASKKVLWADPAWQSGMLGGSWREVPSNTKANLFVEFAKATEPFRSVIEQSPNPNALTTLQSLEPDKGCQISYAADMCAMLTDGVTKQESVDKRIGMVAGADWDDSTSSWTVQLQAKDNPSINTVSSTRLVLCTGSTPISHPISVPNLSLQSLSLETIFSPQQITRTLPPATPTTIAVIGASHSAILVLLNLVQLARTSHPLLKINWFTRHAELKYAIFKKDYILHDNTGLKGVAADWARANLEDDVLPRSDARDVVRKINCAADERAMYARHLPECDYIVQAVGFANNALPKLSRNGRPLAPTHDPARGGFVDAHTGDKVPGLFGAGIAFPERVTDPEGNVEMNVGLWKFMKFLKKVTPSWMG